MDELWRSDSAVSVTFLSLIVRGGMGSCIELLVSDVFFFLCACVCVSVSVRVLFAFSLLVALSLSLCPPLPPPLHLASFAFFAISHVVRRSHAKISFV